GKNRVYRHEMCLPVDRAKFIPESRQLIRRMSKKSQVHSGLVPHKLRQSPARHGSWSQSVSSFRWRLSDKMADARFARALIAAGTTRPRLVRLWIISSTVTAI